VTGDSLLKKLNYRGGSVHKDTTKEFAGIAVQKIEFFKRNPLGYFISTMMAGAYVGVGIILILTLGNDAEPASRNLIMGCFFGIALILIIFAGAELFSGHIMFMTFGFLYKKIGALQAIRDWVVCWYGNLFGAVLLSILFALGGGGGLMGDSSSLVHQLADYKMNSSITELLARAIMCNWLLCLAIWMTAKTDSDTAKCILIFWCLFAFVSAGFEHSIANMTIFTISLLGNHPDSVTVYGLLYNLAWVSFGNVIGGTGFIGIAYYLTGHSLTQR
jgi:nitrite transporter NirC